MALATVADLIAHLQGFPSSHLVMLESHRGGLLPIQSLDVVPTVLDYFKKPRKIAGWPGKHRMVEWSWGPHCQAAHAREFPRAPDTPVLVLGCVRPDGPLAPETWRPDPEEIEADIRAFLYDDL